MKKRLKRALTLVEVVIGMAVFGITATGLAVLFLRTEYSAAASVHRQAADVFGYGLIEYIVAEISRDPDYAADDTIDIDLPIFSDTVDITNPPDSSPTWYRQEIPYSEGASGQARNMTIEYMVHISDLRDDTIPRVEITVGYRWQRPIESGRDPNPENWPRMFLKIVRSELSS